MEKLFSTPPVAIKKIPIYFAFLKAFLGQKKTPLKVSIFLWQQNETIM